MKETIYKVCMVLYEESPDGDLSREENRCEMYIATDKEKGYEVFDSMINTLRGEE